MKPTAKQMLGFALLTSFALGVYAGIRYERARPPRYEFHQGTGFLPLLYRCDRQTGQAAAAFPRKGRFEWFVVDSVENYVAEEMVRTQMQPFFETFSNSIWRTNSTTP